MNWSFIWSNEDSAFIVEVPELPGCMADGANYQEAVANAERVIGEWVETATELGAPHTRATRAVALCMKHSLSPFDALLRSKPVGQQQTDCGRSTAGGR